MREVEILITVELELESIPVQQLESPFDWDGGLHTGPALRQDEPPLQGSAKGAPPDNTHTHKHTLHTGSQLWYTESEMEKCGIIERNWHKPSIRSQTNPKYLHHITVQRPDYDARCK